MAGVWPLRVLWLGAAGAIAVVAMAIPGGPKAPSRGDARVPQAALECRKYLVTIAVPHRHDERKAEFLPVAIVEILEAPDLLRRALIDARTRLLAGRIFGQMAAHRGTAGKIRMCPDQCQSGFGIGTVDAGSEGGDAFRGSRVLG